LHPPATGSSELKRQRPVLNKSRTIFARQYDQGAE
jgi:hypothetical protein